jgi:hypothetical protein
MCIDAHSGPFLEGGSHGYGPADARIGVAGGPRGVDEVVLCGEAPRPADGPDGAPALPALGPTQRQRVPRRQRATILPGVPAAEVVIRPRDSGRRR